MRLFCEKIHCISSQNVRNDQYLTRSFPRNILVVLNNVIRNNEFEFSVNTEQCEV